MPQFWKLDATQWINAEQIVYAEDHPAWEQPTIDVTMTALQSSHQESKLEPYTLPLTGEARDRILRYLGRDAAPDVL
ncbi:MAG TPA: hypothetical protein VLQ80_04810 [Candidatus Saccharimonadia bacterium]|nr:hypothetical protein [Candidatus Saccharimonadia bacterium]